MLPPKVPLAKQQKKLADRKSDMTAKKLMGLRERAVTVLSLSMNEVMQRKNPGLALAAAQDVLNRTGLHIKTSMELAGADGGPIEHSLTLRFIDSKAPWPEPDDKTAN